MGKVVKAGVLYLTAFVFFIWFLIGKTIGWVFFAPLRMLDNLLFLSYVDVSYKIIAKERPGTLLVKDRKEYRRVAFKARAFYRFLQKQNKQGHFPLWTPILNERSFVRQVRSNRDFLRHWIAFYYYVEDVGGFTAFKNMFLHSVLSVEFMQKVVAYVEQGLPHGERLNAWMDQSLQLEERVQLFIWSLQTMYRYARPIYFSHPSIIASRPLIKDISSLYDDVSNIERMAHFVIERVDAGISDFAARTAFFEHEGLFHETTTCS